MRVNRIKIHCTLVGNSQGIKTTLKRELALNSPKLENLYSKIKQPWLIAQDHTDA